MTLEANARMSDGVGVVMVSLRLMASNLNSNPLVEYPKEVPNPMAILGRTFA